MENRDKEFEKQYNDFINKIKADVKANKVRRARRPSEQAKLLMKIKKAILHAVFQEKFSQKKLKQYIEDSFGIKVSQQTISKFIRENASEKQLASYKRGVHKKVDEAEETKVAKASEEADATEEKEKKEKKGKKKE